MKEAGTLGVKLLMQRTGTVRMIWSGRLHGERPTSIQKTRMQRPPVERKHAAARDPTQRARARNNGEHIQVRLGTTNAQPEFDGEKGEKDGELTGSSCVCSKGTGEDQSGQISSTNREEDVDVVIVVVDPGSIP
jgi:hypothetical protein